MSTWRGKALELFPENRERIIAAENRQELWRDIEREFHTGHARGDDQMVSRCLRYAIWTLHPTPQARTIADVSEAAAHLLYRHSHNLHLWISRRDFLAAQKGLKLHLGLDAYAEFESRFFEKTKGYPRKNSSNTGS
jgi:hypothetical protein